MDPSQLYMYSPQLRSWCYASNQEFNPRVSVLVLLKIDDLMDLLSAKSKMYC